MDKFSVWRNLPERLSNQEIMRLMKEYKEYGSEEARQKLIESHLRFVRYYVSKYMRWLIRCQSSIEPDIEDLMQQGTMVLMRAIDKFDLSYNFQFSTYLSGALEKSLSNLKRSKNVKLAQNTRSLYDFTNWKKSDSGIRLIDKLGDDNLAVDKMNEDIEVKDLKKILMLLPKKKRDIYLANFVEGKPQKEIAERYGIDQTRVSRLVISASKQIRDMYEFGVTEIDQLARGVDLSPTQKEKVRKIHGFIKTYGRGFLEDYFCLKLTPNQRDVFKECYFNYYGQTASEISKKLNMSVNGLTKTMLRIQSFIDDNIERLFEEYKKGQEVKPRKLPLKIQQRINRNRRMVNEFGGELFLRKYFLPTLTELERKCFDAQILSFHGESQDRIAKKVGVSVNNLYMLTEKVVKKLETTDFGIVVDMIDNAEQKQILPTALSVSNVEKVKRRMEVVKKYGGADALRKHFLPILPEQQRTVFDMLYLRPTFATYDSMSEATGMRTAFIIKCEKVILEKLSQTDIAQLQRISQMVDRELKAPTKETVKKRKTSKYRDIIAKNGGLAFLRERFVPNLIRADEIIFEKYMVEGRHLAEINEMLKLNKNSAYVHKVIVSRIMPMLQEFRESFEDFDAEVRSFYMQKDFELIHDEDFEKMAFGEPEQQEKQEEPREMEEFEDPKVYSQKQIEKWGGKKVVAKEFMPKFKTVREQLMILYSIVQELDESEVFKNMGLNWNQFKTVKKAVSDKLDNFAEERSKKTNKEQKQEKSKNQS